MTPSQKDLARHALGLSGQCKRSYRNHFVTGPGSEDHAEWMAIVQAGEAIRRAGSTLPYGGDDLFRLTRAGAEAALNPGDQIDKELSGV